MKKHMNHLLKVIKQMGIITQEYRAENHMLTTINEMNERHLKIAESEIKRLNVILNHTEMKYDEKVRNENET